MYITKEEIEQYKDRSNNFIHSKSGRNYLKRYIQVCTVAIQCINDYNTKCIEIYNRMSDSDAYSDCDAILLSDESVKKFIETSNRIYYSLGGADDISDAIEMIRSDCVGCLAIEEYIDSTNKDIMRYYNVEHLPYRIMIKNEDNKIAYMIHPLLTAMISELHEKEFYENHRQFSKFTALARIYKLE